MEQLGITPPSDVMAVEYIKNFMYRFPNATMAEVASYIENQMPWAIEAPYVQQRIAELFLVPPKSWGRTPPLAN